MKTPRTPRPSPYVPRRPNWGQIAGSYALPAANFIYDYATQGTQTRNQARRAPSGSGASTSKAAGRITSRSRPSSVFNNTLMSKGVCTVIERGGVLDGGASTATAGNTVAVGHCDMPSAAMHLLFWRAMVKQLFIHLGVYDLPDMDATVPSGNIGDVVRLTWRASPDSSLVDLNYTFVGGDTYIQIALFFYVYFETPANVNYSMEFKRWAFIPTAASVYRICRINLTGARVYLQGKSDLKVQNRTVSSLNDEDAEDVDNVPLYGRSYYGKGSGATAYTNDTVPVTAAAGFVASRITGCLSKVPTEIWYQEPPPPSHFDNVKLVGKVLLDPGHVKTSSLATGISMGLNKAYQLYFGTSHTAAVTHPRHYIGKYRFLILEKMINAVTGTEANSIKVAFETNCKLGALVQFKRDTTSAVIVDVGSIGNVN